MFWYRRNGTTALSTIGEAVTQDDIVEPVGDQYVEQRDNSDGLSSNGGGSSLGAQFPSPYHKDAYLLFRALCKLSMKGLNEDGQPEAIALQNKSE